MTPHFDAVEMERLLVQIEEAVANRVRMSHRAIEAQKLADDAGTWEQKCLLAYTQFCNDSRQKAQRLPA